MTPQESQALQTLLSQLTQVRGITKDPQAEMMIAQAVSQQPDATYLLIQRSMILEQALEAAKGQISELQKQVQTAPPQAAGTSFLNSNTWGNSGGGAERSVTGAVLPPNTPQQNMTPPATAARAAAPGFLGGGAGSMLGTIAATAAGVAGGAFLFHGIGNLLGNQHTPAAAAAADKSAAEPAPAADTHAAADNQDAGMQNTVADTSVADTSVADNSSGDDLFSGDSFFDDGSSFDV